MKRNLTALIFAMCVVFFSSPIFSQDSENCEPSPLTTSDLLNAKRINRLLKDKQFAAIDDELNDKKRRYEKKEYSDLVLYEDVSNAVKNEASLEPLLAQWVAETPKSMFARLLKAKNHISVGFSKRGLEVADKTSVEQLSAMESELKKAFEELNIAQALDPNSALSAAALIEIARAVAGVASVREILLNAEKKDPENLVARYYAINALSPRWGGSFEDLDAILARSGKTSLDIKKVRLLQYQVEMEKAHHFEIITKEKTKAIVLYRSAAQICSFITPWSGVARAAYEIEDWKSLKEATTQVISGYPKHLGSFQKRAWANEKLGLMSEAVNDYQVAADLGDAWAINKLGYLYMIGNGVAKDLQRAKLLLTSAVAKGNANAQANLDSINRQLGGQ